MPQGSELPPSLESISTILAKLPAEALLRCKHRLSCVRKGRHPCQLLRAMILLTLDREAEARLSLESLGDDPAAAHLRRSRWGDAAGREAGPLTLEQEAGLAWSVAQVYTLLAGEKWCSSLARDEAYRRAIQALRVSSADAGELEKLSAVAREECGLGFVPGLGNGDAFPLRLGEAPGRPVGISPAAPLLSCQAQPLCSTGTPVSFISHLEISASPTMQFITGSPGKSKGAGGGDPSPEEPHSPKPLPMGGIDASQAAIDLAGLQITQPAEDDERFTQHSKQCNKQHSKQNNKEHSKQHSKQNSKEHSEQHSKQNSKEHSKQHSKQNSKEHSKQHSEQHGEHSIARVEKPRSPVGSPHATPATSPSQRSLGPPQEFNCKSVQTSFPTPLSSTAGPGPSSDPARSPCPPPEPPTEEGQFFTFVVLHAGEDEEIACRVQQCLEDLGVPDGATYCEHFQVPGRCELSCFEEALDNSAFTLLLLTKNFNSRLCTFQTNVALQDSFNRFVKANSVIPFVPRESPVKKRDMPLLLAGLVELDENASIFARRVKRTFTPATIREKKLLWSHRQRLREERRLVERQREHARMRTQLSAHVTHNQGPDGTTAGLDPWWLQYPAFPVPTMHNSSPPSLTHSMPSGAQPPQFIIQHAQMVQIGDYNHMHVEKTHAALGQVEEEDAEDEEGRDGSGDMGGD